MFHAKNLTQYTKYNIETLIQKNIKKSPPPKKSINQMNELLIKYEERIENDKYCVNCNSVAEEQYSRYIFGDKYIFCGEWCSYDTEHQIRKSLRR
jgi:hypothetical protein